MWLLFGIVGLGLLVSLFGAVLLGISFMRTGLFGDDHADTFEGSTTITLDATGAGEINGRINRVSDVDMFKFVSPIDGMLTIRLESLDMNLDPVLWAFDENRVTIAQNDDAEGLNSRVSIPVAKDKTYYVKADRLRGIGNYRLSIVAGGGGIAPPPPPPPPGGDDYPNTFQQAHTVNVGSGSATINGRIDFPQDEDMFKFTAPGNGTMTVGMDSASPSGLDPVLFIYDSNQRQIAFNDDAVGLNSRVTFPVVANQVYYVKASKLIGTGPYRLTFSLLRGGFLPSRRTDTALAQADHPRRAAAERWVIREG